MTPAIQMNAWQPPKELIRSAPRPVRWNAAGLFMTGVVAALIGGGVLTACFLYVKAQRSQEFSARLAREGDFVRGEITEIGRPFGEDKRRKATYRFTVDGQAQHAHQATTTLGRRAAKDLEPGSSVQVHYLRTDPDRNWLIGREPEQLPLWLGPLVGALMCLSAWPLAYQLAKQRALLSEGRPARGRVTETKKISSAGHGHFYRVYYEFRTLSGKALTGHFGKSRQPPETGSDVIILYQRDDPQRNAGYPLQFVKVDEDY